MKKKNWENLQTTNDSYSKCDLLNMNEEKKRLAAAKTFIDWVVSPKSGIECSTIKLKYCGPNTGFGVYAKRCIRWNENFIQIPKHLIITADVISEIPEYSKILQRNSFEPFEVLTLFFCLEKLYLDWLSVDEPSVFNYDKNCFENNLTLSEFLHARRCSTADKTSNWLCKNRSSPWFAAYLNILPQKFNTAIAYCQQNKISPNQIEKYLPSAVSELFKRQVTEYDHVMKQLTGALLGFYCQKMFSWAWHIVNTRCIWIDPSEFQCSAQIFSKSRKVLSAKNVRNDCVAVIPLVDMLNHNSNAQCIATYDKTLARYLISAQNRAIKKGSQIFVCYGPHDNARLWLEYGFCLGANNIFNRVNISTDLFIALVKHSDLAQLTSEHERIIHKADLSCTIYSGDDEPSYTFKKNCELALLHSSQLKNWKNVVYCEKRSILPDKMNEVIKAGCGNISKLKIEYLAKKILKDLCAQLEFKLTNIDKLQFCDFWTDQIKILKKMLTLYTNRNYLK